MAYGSTRETWDHFSTALGLTADLLPLVSNPDAKIAEKSTMQSVGKTPSVFNRDREVVGLGKWTQRQSTGDDVRRWAREPDYGICVQTRRVRAFDIDVPEGISATAIQVAIVEATGIELPTRYRQGTGKCLLAFALDQEAFFPKRVLPVDGGIVELLGDGQQFVADGHHASGTRYEWDGGLPERIPALTLDQVEAACDALRLVFGTADWKIARERHARDGVTITAADERADWLLAHWDIFDSGPDDQLYLRCPFEGEHSSDSGLTSTAYFPRGTGGFERGHWVCLHGHCTDRTDEDFDEKCGYRYSSFSALPVAMETVVVDGKELVRPVRELPQFSRNKAGKIDPTATDLAKALAHPVFCGAWISYDTFLDDIMLAPPEQIEGRQQWRSLKDTDYQKFKIALEGRGFWKLGKEGIRDAVHLQAEQATIDSAQEWLNRLTWDGTTRIDDFLALYFGVEPSDYAQAVSRYMWSAMAGRILSPGCQADMVPVFCGEQGARKTSAIKAIAPSGDHYVEINMTERDDNLSRKLRGKLVGELEELRGLNGRDANEIKAWITRTHEEWTPKFKERSFKFPRRLLLFGTHNENRFLADPTGERRWLPFVAATHGPIQPEAIARDRGQLWAEAALRFRVGGIDWSDAERLAKKEHAKFKIVDTWEQTILNWSAEPNVVGVLRRDAGFSIPEALGACGLLVGSMTAMHAARMTRVLATIGFREENGHWVRG